MHSEFILWHILFRFTLFFLLAYKLYELLTRYVLPYFYKELKKEKDTHTEILEKEKLLSSTHRKLEDQISQQKRTFIILEKNVKNWHNFLFQQAASYENALQQQAQQIIQKRATQQIFYTESKIAHKIIPNVISQVQKTLFNNCYSPEGKKFLSNVINHLTSSNSKYVDKKG
jgi:hypothetical protein